MQPLLIRTGVLASISLVLSGCASTMEAVLPQDGPAMKQIYEEHVQKVGRQDPLVVRRELGNRAVLSEQAEGYVRDARNEIDTRFPRLPNPTLVMFVFPHLAGKEGTPVPGYATTFPMFERVEYALPGEAPSQTVPSPMVLPQVVPSQVAPPMEEQ
jgi:conjugative transfer region lipoprotein (TIGR03751 family)